MRIKVIILATIATFALDAAAASNASALPWFSLPIIVLLSIGKGENFNDTDVNKTGSVTIWKSSTVNVECKKNTGKGNIKGGSPGTSENTITFTECSASDAGCTVKSPGSPVGTIVAEYLMELVYIGTKEQAEKQAPPVGALLRPKTGETYLKLTFEGEKCALAGEDPMKGTAIAELSPKATLGATGEKGVLAKAPILLYPSTPITKAFLGGPGTTEFTKKPGLTLLSNTVTQVSEEAVELLNGDEYGFVSL
ncbi:MAG TPA: hypothetical protein VK756_10200 [Solirubrobacteraceae bacterium]|jgi:hypothetical protein|nr:hypothetical protein [Solirubrobacteraceae bacterium]